MKNITYVLYHDKCLDGIAASEVVGFYEQDKYEIRKIGVRHGEICPIINDLTKDDRIFIVDFSYDINTIVELSRRCKEVILIDHHKTWIELSKTFTNRPKNFTEFTSYIHSGCVLAWLYYHTEHGALENCPLFLKYIEDRDLWSFMYEHTKEFTEGLLLMEENTMRYEMYNLLIGSDTGSNKKIYDDIIKQGVYILEKNKRDIDNALRFRHKVVINNQEILAVNSNTNISEIGNILATDSLDGIGAVWYFDGTCYKYSLRSIGDVDTTVTSKQFGGGGHKNASGFSVDTNFIIKQLQ